MGLYKIYCSSLCLLNENGIASYSVVIKNSKSKVICESSGIMNTKKYVNQNVSDLHAIAMAVNLVRKYHVDKYKFVIYTDNQFIYNDIRNDSVLYKLISQYKDNIKCVNSKHLQYVKTNSANELKKYFESNCLDRAFQLRKKNPVIISDNKIIRINENVIIDIHKSECNCLYYQIVNDLMKSKGFEHIKIRCKHLCFYDLINKGGERHDNN